MPFNPLGTSASSSNANTGGKQMATTIDVTLFTVAVVLLITIATAPGTAPRNIIWKIFMAVILTAAMVAT